ncbi:MAG: hypothetical protein K9N51_11100 [Candidatus Pacebacteria bacterium]|nr:hypothetical protein [Candidatus Paceibacterota bacterium]
MLMPPDLPDWLPENHIARRKDRIDRLEKARAVIEERYESGKWRMFFGGGLMVLRRHASHVRK